MSQALEFVLYAPVPSPPPGRRLVTIGIALASDIGARDGADDQPVEATGGGAALRSGRR